jgi:hypothetical protein
MKIGQFPVVEARPIERARVLDRLARERAAYLPDALFKSRVPTRGALDAAQATAERLRRQMIAEQEDLDWEVYRLYRLIPDDLTYPRDRPRSRSASERSRFFLPARWPRAELTRPGSNVTEHYPL